MQLSPGQSEQLSVLAKRLISGLELVELAARAESGTTRERSYGGPSLAVPDNPMVGPARAAHHLGRIREQQLQNIRQLIGEPFVARVLVEDETGNRQSLYFARAVPPTTPVDGLDGRLASYRSPLGRLAELQTGDSLELGLPGKPRRAYTVLERALLSPKRTDQGWDGFDNQIEAPALLVTLDSLRQFLRQLEAVVAEPEDLLGRLLEEARAAASVREGIRRRLIDRISLRDQPVLDRWQGEIFRLALNRRLMLTGPPGTGKTTTLIRRLAQKRNAEEIGEEELSLVPRERLAEFFHPENWIMFTPTELLRLYLKEAFAKEGVAASDERVRTWAEERRRLARDVFRILRSERGGRFTLDDSANIVVDPSSTGLVALAEAFSRYVERQVVEEYASALEFLGAEVDPGLAGIVGRIRRRLGAPSIAFEQLFHLTDFREELRHHVNRLNEVVTEAHRRAVNTRLARDPEFLDRLAQLVESLSTDSEDEEEEDDAEPEIEELMPAVARDRRIFASDVFRRAIFARGRALVEGRWLTRTSRNAQVLVWLGDRVPDDGTLRSLGATLTRLRRARFLANPYRVMIDRVPARYRRFRRAALQEGNWYAPEAVAAIERGRVAGLEVDVMLVLMLRHVRRFLTRGAGRDLAEDTRLAVLEAVKSEYVTQVLVDEATDFSPVQLACMLELAHPEFRSVFACGDVRQRVTQWGVRELQELRWVSPDFEVREVQIGYRQTRRLVEFASAVAQLDGGAPPILALAEVVQEADVPPALGENLRDGLLAQWLRDRILEIERQIGQVPSIAIFVDGDARIDPVVEELRPLLAEHNVDVVGCKEGRVIGGEGQVRVFDVQYIKGLEFEAVCFVGVDELVARLPNLYDKFLYVGITRAATYVGLTCELGLPGVLEHLRAHMSIRGWG